MKTEKFKVVQAKRGKKIKCEGGFGMASEKCRKEFFEMQRLSRFGVMRQQKRLDFDWDEMPTYAGLIRNVLGSFAVAECRKF